MINICSYFQICGILEAN